MAGRSSAARLWGIATHTAWTSFQASPGADVVRTPLSKRLRWQPYAVCNLRPRSFASSAASATGEQSFLKRQKIVVQEIEKELAVMEQDMGNANKKAIFKKDLDVIKNMFKLSSGIAGKDVSKQDAFDALRHELQSLHEVELNRLHQLQANSFKDESTVSGELAAGELRQQTPAMLGAAACACAAAFAAWHFLARPTPLVAKADLTTNSEAASPSSTAGAAPSTVADTQPPGPDSNGGGDCEEVGSSALSKPVSKVADTDTWPNIVTSTTISTAPSFVSDAAIYTVASGTASPDVASSSQWQTGMYCLASITVLAGLAVGTWWLLSTCEETSTPDFDGTPSVDGEAVSIKLPVDASSAAVVQALSDSTSVAGGPGALAASGGAAALSTLEATASGGAAAVGFAVEQATLAASFEELSKRKSHDTVFENTPSESQVWDMSASIRGVSGGVKRLSRKFEEP